MDQIDGKTAELDFAYEPDYKIEDVVLYEPFWVMKAKGQGLPAWWANRGKVESLIAGFKQDFTIAEACVQAGISLDQYKYFSKIHPTFSTVKARCKAFGPIVAKQGLMKDLVHPSGFRSRQWYLERKQPHIYGRDIGAYTPPPPQAAEKLTAEAFLDQEGNMITSKQTREILKKEYGESEPGASNPTADKAD